MSSTTSRKPQDAAKSFPLARTIWRRTMCSMKGSLPSPETAPALKHMTSLALVGLATALSTMAGQHLAATDVVMLHLGAIALAATRLGRGPAVTAAAASVLAYDFFRVPPYHTLKVEDERHLLTFAMMFGMGLFISHLSTRIRREALQARAAAVRADIEETRSSLLSSVSHDLRTPLATITGAASTLRDQNTNLDAEQRSELIDAICVEAERLERLVRNLLDMTRLQAGVGEVKREWVPLDEIVGSALSRVEAQLSGRKVSAEIPADLPLVSVDPLLIEQLFVNLLENVARHTPPATAVEIRARACDGGLEADVADHGTGIPLGLEQRIFDKFFRATAAANGAGLGLAVCRAIAVAHGGTLEVVGGSGGALFRLRLPAVGAAPSIPEDTDALTERGRADET
jgi:K+-sensing histidine kinase KdpD